ncbi:hypothetical protein [Planctomicrobium sp. SH664]|uniref:hypothetical protein n=1 Tax=Planctomicrobium sp. SH664 TaxID=3448125 RepID=UPI003F5C520A
MHAIAVISGPERITLIFYNVSGLLMFLASFGIAIWMGSLVGRNEESFLMVVGGGLLTLFDLTHRWLRSGWLGGMLTGGGSLFFLPAWLLGIFWFVWGSVSLLLVE